MCTCMRYANVAPFHRPRLYRTLSIHRTLQNQRFALTKYNDVDYRWIIETSNNKDAKYIYLNALVINARPSSVLSVGTRLDWIRRRLMYLQSTKYLGAYIERFRHKKIHLQALLYMWQTDKYLALSDHTYLQDMITSYLTRIPVSSLR